MVLNTDTNTKHFKNMSYKNYFSKHGYVFNLFKSAYLFKLCTLFITDEKFKYVLRIFELKLKTAYSITYYCITKCSYI